jgi:hypothetical protein
MGSVGKIDHCILRQLLDELLELGDKLELLLLIGLDGKGLYLFVDKVEFG